ncbi:hypothetical protein [Metamycoplasma hominis]
MKKWTKMLLTLGLVTTSTICFPLVAASRTKKQTAIQTIKI